LGAGVLHELGLYPPPDGDIIKTTFVVPLTDNSVDYYDVQEILELGELDADKRNTLERIYDSVWLYLYNKSVEFGLTDQIKLTFNVDLIKLDPDYIKTVKVKKVYFTFDQCETKDNNCNFDDSKNKNINFIESFFMNVSPVDEKIGAQDSSDEDFEFIRSKEFERNVQKTTVIKYKNDNLLFDRAKLIGKGRDLKLYNVDLSFTKYLEFFRKKEFENIIEEVSSRVQKRPFVKRFIRIKLKENTTRHDLESKIEKMLYPLKDKIVLLRLKNKDKIIEYKNEMARPYLKKYIEKSRLVGDSLFVELKSASFKNKFLQNLKNSSVFSLLDFIRIDSCEKNNCVSPTITESNLVGLLSETSMLKFDLFFALNSLNLSDFKYNGFIELEVGIKSPI